MHVSTCMSLKYGHFVYQVLGNLWSVCFKKHPAKRITSYATFNKMVQSNNRKTKKRSRIHPVNELPVHVISFKCLVVYVGWM